MGLKSAVLAPEEDLSPLAAGGKAASKQPIQCTKTSTISFTVLNGWLYFYFSKKSQKIVNLQILDAFREAYSQGACKENPGNNQLPLEIS